MLAMPWFYSLLWWSNPRFIPAKFRHLAALPEVAALHPLQRRQGWRWAVVLLCLWGRGRGGQGRTGKIQRDGRRKGTEMEDWLPGKALCFYLWSRRNRLYVRKKALKAVGHGDATAMGCRAGKFYLKSNLSLFADVSVLCTKWLCEQR